VVHTVSLFAEVGMFKGVGVSNMDPGSWGEGVVFESGKDLVVTIDKCPKTGRGHDGDESLS